MKITEKMLEDWICENPKDTHFIDSILGRQIALRHGILDVLGWSDTFGILVVELKRGLIREQDVGQVLRYIHDIDKMLSDMWFELDYDWREIDAPSDRLVKLAIALETTRTEHTISQEILADELKPDPKCRPMIIGHSIDEKAYSAAMGAGAIVLMWDFDIVTSKFKFDWSEIDKHGEPFTDYYPDWAVELAIRHTWRMQQKASYIFDMGIRKLMGV